MAINKSPEELIMKGLQKLLLINLILTIIGLGLIFVINRQVQKIDNVEKEITNQYQVIRSIYSTVIYETYKQTSQTPAEKK